MIETIEKMDLIIPICKDCKFVKICTLDYECPALKMILDFIAKVEE